MITSRIGSGTGTGVLSQTETLSNVGKASSPWSFPTIRQDSRFALGFVLAGATFALFSPLLWFEFCLYDDPGYVFENVHVVTGLSWSNLIWALTSLHGGVSYWHPVTWISHQLDCHLFGLSAGAHHLTSLAIHIASTLLLFRFLLQATSNLFGSVAVAALFALHPLHVESVAWISERKDMLYGFWWIASLNVYTAYVKRRSRFSYFALAAAFVLALASKPSAVTFPFTVNRCSNRALHGSPFLYCLHG
jgi:hypothetical protein